MFRCVASREKKKLRPKSTLCNQSSDWLINVIAVTFAESLLLNNYIMGDFCCEGFTGDVFTTELAKLC